MERLTARIDDGAELDEIAFINPQDPEGLYNLRDIVEYSSDEQIYKIADRLAAYEDTGLEPDEIPHWIPVSERLPETGGIYLTYAPCTWPVQSANFTTICGKPQFSTMNHGGVLHGVTHWMPLPAAPKEEK